MIDFDRKPTPKSEIELECDRLHQEYYEKFGVSFGYSIGRYIPQTIEEEIEEIKECLRTGKKQKAEPWDGSRNIVL